MHAFAAPQLVMLGRPFVESIEARMVHSASESSGPPDPEGVVPPQTIGPMETRIALETEEALPTRNCSLENLLEGSEFKVVTSPPPTSPNAVRSQSKDPRHAIAALRYSGTPDATMRALAELVATLPRSHVTTFTEGNLHAECTSYWLGFVDDLELRLNDHDRVIHVRSAYCLGYSDFGDNRARVG